MIRVTIIIRMTKLEVERDLLPNMPPPPGGYFYWWDNKLIIKFPLADGEIAEVPCILNKDDMMVEVVDAKDIYELPTDDDDCDCAFCAGKLCDGLPEIPDD